MSDHGSDGTCACCDTRLARGPRYVLEFRACGACLTRHESLGVAAPPLLPDAQRLQQRSRPLSRACPFRSPHDLQQACIRHGAATIFHRTAVSWAGLHVQSATVRQFAV
jgi:hypothetical protein